MGGPLFHKAKGAAPFHSIESVDDLISIEYRDEPVHCTRGVSWAWRDVFSEDAPGVLHSSQDRLLIRVVHGTRLTKRGFNTESRSDRSHRSSAHSGVHFLCRDRAAAMKKAASTTSRTTGPIVSVSKSDANRAGMVVLRSCCVEPFVVARKALELLLLACSAAQHGSAGGTKRGSRQAVD